MRNHPFVLLCNYKCDLLTIVSTKSDIGRSLHNISNSIPSFELDFAIDEDEIIHFGMKAGSWVDCFNWSRWQYNFIGRENLKKVNLISSIVKATFIVIISGGNDPGLNQIMSHFNIIFLRGIFDPETNFVFVNFQYFIFIYIL